MISLRSAQCVACHTNSLIPRQSFLTSIQPSIVSQFWKDFYHSNQVLIPKRCASSWKKKILKQEKMKNVVIQYAGKNTKRARRVYVWGYAATGALGVRRFVKPEKHEINRFRQLGPHRLDFFNNLQLKVHHASCGYGFSVFACKGNDGTSVYGTGINTDSQLGYVEYPKNSGRILDYVIEPVRIVLPLLYPTSTKVTALSAGRAHTVVATDNEGIYSLGNNAYGQCGRTIVPDEIHRGNKVINKISLDGKIKQIVCGQDHTLFLTESGEVYSCGLGTDGQTGLGHFEVCDRPALVQGDIKGEKICYVTSKADCVLAVNDKGQVFGWGNTEYDQLAAADPSSTQISTPIHLPFNSVGKVVRVATAGSMCALLNENGEVFVWGYGILGKGPKLERTLTPSLIPPTVFGKNEFNTDEKVSDIQAGMNYFAAVTNMGNLYTWGRNKQASLGLGNKLDHFFPLKVQVPAEVLQVFCGVDHTIAISRAYA